MQILEKFVLSEVPQHKIKFAITSEPDYSMRRLLIIEDWPTEDQVTVVNGDHCSCYGFDETSWDATAYTENEIKTLMVGWTTTGDYMERQLSHLYLDRAPCYGSPMED